MQAYSGDGYAWNSLVDMQLGSSLRGGVRIFGKGVRKKGGSDEPLLVTGLRPYGDLVAVILRSMCDG